MRAMGEGARGGRRVRSRASVAVGMSALVALTACSSPAADMTARAARGRSSATQAEAAPSKVEAGSGASTTSGPVTTEPATTTTLAVADSGDGPRSAPPDGPGTALLRAVRVGRHDGFERIVFVFATGVRPGYRMQWVEGPIRSDGSGEPVEVVGDAHLEMVFEPASGVDMADGSPTYSGPDRVDVGTQLQRVTDLRRTGDFEGVLTWVAGATGGGAYRVLTLTAPNRIVVDVAVPDQG